MKLQVPTYPISTFTRTDNETLVGELSTHGRMGRIYDDACDYGLAICGQTRTVLFSVSHEDRNSEGELQSIVLTPLYRGNKAPPQPIKKLILFND